MDLFEVREKGTAYIFIIPQTAAGNVFARQDCTKMSKQHGTNITTAQGPSNEG